VLDGILLEKNGIPAIAIVTEPFVETGKAMASSWGVPEYRFLSMPHPVANLDERELDEQVTALLDDVIGLLKGGQKA